MSTNNPNNKLQLFTGTFANAVKSAVEFLVWLVIGSASLAAAYVAVRAILVAVKITLNALGI